ncbi:MAG: cysteine synthase A [Rikenellaceae bacterium]
MTKIANSITELVGKTPLLRLNRFTANRGVEANIIAKVESFNPAGSIKDRVALSMIEELEESGAIESGSTLIEPTSGNTGVGLAMVAATRGYRLILTMPETMSLERRKLLSALGAELHLTPGVKGMTGAIERASELQGEIVGSVILNQFANPANPAAHYRTTAEEIWSDTKGKIDIVVAGVGTGGTVSGIGARLKELNPSIQIVGVEPSASAVLSGEKAGVHPIQGIGAGFVPDNYNAQMVDRVIKVEGKEAMEAARSVARSEGLLVGISAGAALSAALQLSQEEQNRGKEIVVILPDSGERYLSTSLFEV